MKIDSKETDLHKRDDKKVLLSKTEEMSDRIEDVMTVKVMVREEMVTKLGDVMTEVILPEENQE